MRLIWLFCCVILCWPIRVVLAEDAGLAAEKTAEITAAPDETLGCPEPKPLSEQSLIHKVNLSIDPIFDTSQPDENNWLFRTANALHLDTHPNVIHRDLLFKEGQVLNPLLIRETERRLRGRSYLNSAKVRVEPECDGNARVDVSVKEVWTLEPNIRFSKQGAGSSFGFGVKDSNIFGTGKTINLSHASDDERSTNNFQYLDPNTGYYNSQFEFNYGRNSDGFDQSIRVDKGFESLTALWSSGFELGRVEQIDSLYDAGDVVDEYLQNARVFEIFMGKRIWRSKDHVAHRLVFGSTSKDFSFQSLPDTDDPALLPENNEYFYPWIEYQYRSEKYIETQNIQQINRIEDLNLGVDFRFRLGYSSSEIQALNENLVFDTAFAKTQRLSENQYLIFESSAYGFLKGQKLQNTALNGEVSYHWKNMPYGQFYAHLLSQKVIDPLNNAYLQLGGETGLRGYPSNYQAGDHLRLINIEQRVYGTQEVLSLFYLGGAVFFDGGHTWGESAVPQTQPGWLRSAGFGLRLSNTRLGGKPNGGHSVIHLDLAFPLDSDRDVSSMQFLVKVKSSF